MKSPAKGSEDQKSPQISEKFRQQCVLGNAKQLEFFVHMTPSFVLTHHTLDLVLGPKLIFPELAE